MGVVVDVNVSGLSVLLKPIKVNTVYDLQMIEEAEQMLESQRAG